MMMWRPNIFLLHACLIKVILLASMLIWTFIALCHCRCITYNFVLSQGRNTMSLTKDIRLIFIRPLKPWLNQTIVYSDL